jgi:hypothetical protein
MAGTPVFAATPKVALAQVSAANAGRDGTGTIVDVVTGGTNGSIINCIVVKATATTTAGSVRLFMYDGSNTRLLWEIDVPVKTASASAGAWQYELPFIVYKPHLPGNTWKIRASTEKAETFNITVYYADL